MNPPFFTIAASSLLLVFLIFIAAATVVPAPVTASHKPVIPIGHPELVHQINVAEHSRDNKTLHLDNVHFDENTTLYIEVDVDDAHITLTNSNFTAVVVHLHEPEFVHYHQNLTEGVRFFQDTEVKHAQPWKESQQRRSRGAKLHFRLFNCSVEKGIKFTGATYYHDAHVRFVRYRGGPVVMPRIRSRNIHHAPLISVVNSTIRWVTLPHISGKAHWFHINHDVLKQPLLRFPHNHVDDSMRHGALYENFHAPTIHLYGNRFEHGVVWLNEESHAHDMLDDIIVRNNTFVSASLVNFNEFNSTHGGAEVVGNLFYGEIDPTVCSWAVRLEFFEVHRVLFAENHFELKFRETGLGVSDTVGAQHQTAVDLGLGTSHRCEVINNKLVVRHGEKFFDKGFRIRGGEHLEVSNNHVFLSSRPPHFFLNADHHERNRPQKPLIGIDVVDDNDKMVRRHYTWRVRRYVLIDGNVVNLRRYRPAMPPREQWVNMDPAEKIDDKRPQKEIDRERKKRRRYLKKYHNKVIEKERARTHDMWNDYVRQAYHDPDYDGEHSGGDVLGIVMHTRVSGKYIISNNTVAVNNTWHSAETIAMDVMVQPYHQIWSHSFLDVVGNRLMPTGLASAVGFKTHVLLNASENIIRENEIWCKMGAGNCVELDSCHSGEGPHATATAQGTWIAGMPVVEGRTDFLGTTFRRNKVRAMAWRQYLQHTDAAAIYASGGLDTPDLSHYLQDNDVRGRGLAVFVKSSSPRLIFENNFWKTIGHLGQGFFWIPNTRYLYMHHEQLERAPLSPPDWFESHSEKHFEWELHWRKKNTHPQEKEHPPHTLFSPQFNARHAQEVEYHEARKTAFITASKQHSESLVMLRDDEPVEDEHTLHLEHRPVPKVKFVPSQSRVLPAEGASSSSSAAATNAAGNSVSRSVAEEVAELNHPRATVARLSPVFAENMTFPRQGHGHKERWFSIMCVQVNGRPLDYEEEVRGFLPYKDMPKHELSFPGYTMIHNSTDEVDFGCPDDAHVDKVVGSANEDL